MNRDSLIELVDRRAEQVIDHPFDLLPTNIKTKVDIAVSMPDTAPKFDEADTDELIGLLVEITVDEWIAEQTRIAKQDTL